MTALTFRAVEAEPGSRLVRCPLHGETYGPHGCRIAGCPSAIHPRPRMRARARVRRDGYAEVILSGGSCEIPEGEQYPRSVYETLPAAIRAADWVNRESRKTARATRRRHAARTSG